MQCPDGRCEPEGWCSFPDGECPSGMRFGDHAGDGLAGECTDVGDPGTTSGTSTMATTTTVGSTSTTAPTETTSTQESTGAPEPVCGDGTLEGDEACDDGNEVDSDGCNNDCVESGSVRWEIMYDGPRNVHDRLHDVIVRDTSILAVGREGLDPSRGLFLEVSLDGTMVGSKVEPGPTADQHESILAVIELASGDIVAVGHQHNDAANRVGWIARYTSELEQVWTQQGPEGQHRAVAVAPDGTLLVPGFQVGLNGSVGTVTRWSADGEEIGLETNAQIVPSRIRDVEFIGNDAFGGGTHGPWTGSMCSSLGVVSTTQDPYEVLHTLEPPDSLCTDVQALASSQGELIVAGFTIGGDSADRDAVLRRLDASFAERWTDVFAFSDQSEEYEDVAVAANGDIVGVGFVNGSVDLDGDFFARRLTADGSIRWTQTWDGGGPDDTLRAIAIAENGDLIVAGETDLDGESENGYVARLAP